MKKKLIKKIVIFTVSVFIVLISVTVIITTAHKRNIEKNIINETAEYMETVLNHLETSDYSYFAELTSIMIDNSFDGDSAIVAEEIRNFIQSYDAENGEEYLDWLYEKNIRTLFDSIISGSDYLISVDYFSVSGDIKKSLIYPEGFQDINNTDLSIIIEEGSLTINENLICSYFRTIDNHRIDDTNRGRRVLMLMFDFSQTGSLVLKSTIIMILILFFSAISFLFIVMPDIRFFLYERIDNIKNSLREVLKGNRGVRIYLLGDDEITEIGESINEILDNNIKNESIYQEEMENYSFLFENVPFGMIVLDKDGKLVFENMFIKSLFNGPYEPFPGVFYSVLNKSDSELLLENLSYIISGEKKSFTHRCRLFMGASHHKFFEIRLFLIENPEKSRFVVISFLDLSLNESREKQQIDFYRMDGMSRLAGNIANGLNNILQIINGYTEYLMLGNHDSAELDDVLKKMFNAGNRAGILTRHLKIFSTHNKLLNPVLLDINTLLTGLDNILREILQPEISLKIKTDEEIFKCIGDEGQLEQVVINLCINAKEASVGKGEVEISTGNIKYEESEIRAYPETEPGNYIFIKIKDSGCGIPDNQIRKIFEPFYSTKRKDESGGMGLSVSYGIVLNHKGFIQVTSNEGIGSTFTINIPAVSGEKIPNEEKVLNKGTGKTILFVDDEELIISLGRIILEKAGYHVITASSGKEAVEFVRNYETDIDLMVFDLVMPDMSGSEAVDLIHGIKSNIPVLYISGFAEKAIDVTDNHEILSKPFKRSDLLSRISKLLIT